MRQSLVTIPGSFRQATAPVNHDLLQVADVVTLLEFLNRHKYRLIICVALAVGLAALYLAKCPRFYESNAKLLVTKKDPLNVQGMPQGLLLGSDAMSTHIEVIKSPWLAKQVLSVEELSSLNTFAAEEQPVDALIASIDVVNNAKKSGTYSDTNILEFSFQGTYRDECAVALEGVLDAYRQYLNESTRNANQDASQLITKKKNQIQASLESKKQAYKEFRQSAPKPLSTDRESQDLRQRLQSIKDRKDALKVELAAIKTRMSNWRNATLNGELSSAARAMLPESLKPRWNQRLEEMLLPLLVQEQVSRSAAGIGANHPQAKALRERIEMARQLFASSETEQSDSSNYSVARSNAADTVAEYTIYLEHELAELQASDKSLQEEAALVENDLRQVLDHQRDATQALAEFELKSEQFSKSIARDQQLYDGLMDQLHRHEIDIVAGAYSTTLIAPPSKARQVSPRTLLVYALSLVLGIAGGLAYAFTSEFSKRLRYGAQEAAQSLKAPVLGRIPQVASIGTPSRRSIARPTLDPALWSNGLPDSSVAEAYRVLRTAVLFRAGSQPLKNIVISSPTMEDGASTLAANLAVSFSQSGRRVLLIDGNLRSPCLHEVFDVSNDQGLATVLAGDCDLDDAISKCGFVGLSILPSGPSPARPADLLSAPYLKEALGEIREQFDYVLIDTPGMAAVPDAQILAANSDGVLLTIRCGQKGGAALTWAEETLEQSGANVLGVVLTDAEPQEVTGLAIPAASENGALSHVASTSA